MSDTSDLRTREDYQAIADDMNFPSNAHINGKFTKAKSGKTFETVNPATGKVLAVSPKGTHAGSLTGRCVSRALRSARFKRFARSRQRFYYTVVLR